MVRLSRIAGALSCAAVIATAACSANSTGLTPSAGSPAQAQANGHAFGWNDANGVLYADPHYMRVRGSQPQAVQPNLQLTYGGGAVLNKPKIYLILWGFKANGDPNKVAGLLYNYAKAVGGSAYNKIYTQYYSDINNNKLGISDPLAQFGGVWHDDTDAIPTQPTDGQVAAEAQLGAAHFGYNANGSYVVVTAHNHSSSGFGTQYCAYHSSTTYNSQVMSYTNLPYIPDAGQNCGANIITPPSDETGADEGVTIVEGHEYGESVTDPKPWSGWNSGQGEIGDLCAWQNIQNDPYKTKSYTAQPMFSNKTSSCVHSY